MNIRPNSLNIVFGRKRCGKSTFACYLARKWIKSGHKVYSNMPIPNTLPIFPTDLGMFHVERGSLILIDEAGNCFNNREWKSFKGNVRQFLQLQGHFKCTVFLFSQGLDIDKAVRLLCDDLYIQKKIFKYFTYLKHISRAIVVTKASDFGGSDICDEYIIDSPLKVWEHKLLFMPPYWKDFDSYAIPSLPSYDDYMSR